MENALTERDADSIYSVTELANLLGITPRAIRFYESKGLVSPRRAGTTRVYNYRDRGRLQIILRGKRLGFSLAEIGEYMHLYDANPSQSEQLTMLLEKINQRLNSLERQKSDLAALVAELNDIRLQALDALNRTHSQTRTGTN